MKTILSLIAVMTIVLLSSFSIDSQRQLNSQLGCGNFSAFSLKKTATGVSLAWRVSDPRITGFAIERSEDGNRFRTACAVTARNNNVFQDLQTNSGNYHYRIAAIHSDGTVEYSPVREVRI